jgi:DNA polymerase-1
VDTPGLIFRAFFSIRDLTSPEGIPVNAVYGLMLQILKVLRDLNPAAAAAFFDTPDRGFRAEQFEDYKANRPAAPDELIHQFPITIEAMEAGGCPVLLEPGFEADDLIASYAKRHAHRFKLILSGDRDMLQLLDDKTYVMIQTKGVTNVRIYTPQVFKDEYGFEPSSFVDYKALRGDPSDNIPGVRGVGEKTAKKWIAEFGSLEGLYDHIEEVSPERIREAIREAKGEVFGYRELVRLCEACELPAEHEEIRLPDFSREEFLAFCDKYGLRQIRKQVGT